MFSFLLLTKSPCSQGPSESSCLVTKAHLQCVRQDDVELSVYFRATKRQTTSWHNCHFRIASQLKEAGVNPQRHKQNMRAPCRKAPGNRTYTSRTPPSTTNNFKLFTLNMYLCSADVTTTLSMQPQLGVPNRTKPKVGEANKPHSTFSSSCLNVPLARGQRTAV